MQLGVQHTRPQQLDLHTAHNASDHWLYIETTCFYNPFEIGLGIQASRFNHSCSSNAEATFDDKNEIREIRAVTNIKAGEELVPAQPNIEGIFQ